MLLSPAEGQSTMPVPACLPCAGRLHHVPCLCKHREPTSVLAMWTHCCVAGQLPPS